MENLASEWVRANCRFAAAVDITQKSGNVEGMDAKQQATINLRKAKAAKEFGPAPKSLKTAGAWMQGPWYYVYLKPNWVLKTAGVAGEEMSIDHPDYWVTLVDTVIAPFYKINDPMKIKALKNMPYCMPRGRVQYMRKMGGPRLWNAYHGRDFAYTMDEKKKIAAQFNLLPQLYEGMLRFVPDLHEAMLPADFQRFQTLAAKFDAKNLKRVNLQKPEEVFEEEPELI